MEVECLDVGEGLRGNPTSRFEASAVRQTRNPNTAVTQAPTSKKRLCVISYRTAGEIAFLLTSRDWAGMAERRSSS